MAQDKKRKIYKYYIALALFLVAASFGAGQYLDYYIMRSGPLKETKTIIITPGESLGLISSKLVQEGILREKISFKLLVWLRGEAAALKSGEYEFPPAISLRDVIDVIRSGQVKIHKFTLVEGWTSQKVVYELNKAYGLKGHIESLPPEGSLLPQTYHYQYGDARQHLLQRMQTSMEQLLEQLWQQRPSLFPLASKADLVILASIVEKETGIKEERPLVASVFLNRLQQGMKLQSDPTVIYGLAAHHEGLGRPLTSEDLKQFTPYNTYLHKGLPPTPIANPGLASLKAVLFPAPTNYLYFVANGTGGHTFTASWPEHSRNVQYWRKIRKTQALLGKEGKTIYLPLRSSN